MRFVVEAKAIEYPISDQDELVLKWPSFLEYLGLKLTPPFDPNRALYQASIAALKSGEKETVFYVFDNLFAEILTWLKGLEQLQPQSLLQSVAKSSNPKLLAPIANRLRTHPKETMHDLILYLGWDRISIFIAELFDYQTNEVKFIQALEVLKECLIESFQHITSQGKTHPSLYRLFEALVFYYLREEKLQNLDKEGWATLSQSFPLLKAQEALCDCFYIDDAIFPSEEPSTYLTLDSPTTVKARLQFANLMMRMLKAQVPSWNYILHPKTVLTL